MNNQVDDFFRFDAGEENLKVTEHTVENIVKSAKENKKKVICFVSGVPGAGKASQPEDHFCPFLLPVLGSAPSGSAL